MSKLTQIFKHQWFDPAWLKNHKKSKLFGKFWHKHNLWHINQSSLARSFAVGLFCAFVPIPIQMMLAMTLAIMANAYLPIAVALVWLTNPVTIPPVFYFCYKLGAYLLQVQPEPVTIEFTWSWVISQLSQIWQPLVVGSLICGLTCSLLGYTTIHILWYFSHPTSPNAPNPIILDHKYVSHKSKQL